MKRPTKKQRTVAKRLARGEVTIRKARALFGVTALLREGHRVPRATVRLAPSGLRSALGGAR